MGTWTEQTTGCIFFDSTISEILSKRVKDILNPFVWRSFENMKIIRTIPNSNENVDGTPDPSKPHQGILV